MSSVLTNENKQGRNVRAWAPSSLECGGVGAVLPRPINGHVILVCCGEPSGIREANIQAVRRPGRLSPCLVFLIVRRSSVPTRSSLSGDALRGMVIIGVRPSYPFLLLLLRNTSFFGYKCGGCM